MNSQIVINEAKVEHDGQYHCYAQSKAGSFDVDITLNVLGSSTYNI